MSFIHFSIHLILRESFIILHGYFNLHILIDDCILLQEDSLFHSIVRNKKYNIETKF